MWVKCNNWLRREGAARLTQQKGSSKIRLRLSCSFFFTQFRSWQPPGLTLVVSSALHLSLKVGHRRTFTSTATQESQRWTGQYAVLAAFNCMPSWPLHIRTSATHPPYCHALWGNVTVGLGNMALILIFWNVLKKKKSQLLELGNRDILTKYLNIDTVIIQDTHVGG